MNVVAMNARPRGLSEVIGQTTLVKYIRKEVECSLGGEKSGRSLVLAGTSGHGVFTLARMYAKALCCPAQSPPCAQCDTCRKFEEGKEVNFTLIDCGLIGDAGAFEEINLVSAANAIGRFGWRVILIRNAQRLSAQSFEALHGRFKNPGERKTFILTASALRDLPSRSLSLFQCFTIERPTISERLQLLDRAVQRNNLPADKEVLQIIAEHSQSGFRAPLRDLERLAGEGDITLATARKLFGLDLEAPAAVYVDRVFERRSLEEQIAAMEAWGVGANEKWQAIEAFFEKAFRWEHHSFGPVSAQRLSELRKVHDGITSRATTLRCSNRELFEAILEFWKIDGLSTNAALLRKVLGFNRCLNETSASNVLSELRRNTTLGPVVRGEMRYEHSTSGSRVAGFLSRDQAKKLWDAASFCVQEYGTLLNTSITIRYSEFGIHDVGAATKKLTSLLQEMRQLIKRKIPDVEHPLHWLYVNEITSSGIETHVAAHIPPLVMDTIEGWLQDSAVPRLLNSAPGSPGLDFKGDRLHDLTRQYRRHYARIKMLCRGLDPSLREDVYAGNEFIGQWKLTQLLKIPKCCCRSIGQISDAHRHNESRHLANKAREVHAEQRLALLSAFVPEGFQWITSKWELKEHKERKELKLLRKEQRQRLEEKFSGDTPRERKLLEDAIAEWLAAMPIRAEDRPRKWPVWPARYL